MAASQQTERDPESWPFPTFFSLPLSIYLTRSPSPGITWEPEEALPASLPVHAAPRASHVPTVQRATVARESRVHYHLGMGFTFLTQNDRTTETTIYLSSPTLNWAPGASYILGLSK